MNFLRNFFLTVSKSLFDPVYYRSVLPKSFWYSARYLYGVLYCVMLVAGIGAAYAFVILYPALPGFIDDTKSSIHDLFPAELLVTVDKGMVSTNVEEPYFIGWPERWFPQNADPTKKDDQPTHLVTIDTSASIDDYDHFDTLILVTEKAIVYPDKNSGYRVYRIPEDAKMVIDRAGYTAHVDVYLPFLDYLYPLFWVWFAFLILVFPFITAFLSLLGSLIYLLIPCVLLLIITRVAGKEHTYGQVYRLSMHGLTWPLIATCVLSFLGVHILWLYTAILLGWMTYVFVKMPKAVTHKKATKAKLKKS